MLASAIIENKRDGYELSTDEIRFMIRGLVDGSVPDYQVSAWAMAILCCGMSDAETAALTECMLASGGRLERATDRSRVDKHSTGGLGDKVSLVLAPLLACFDVDVPMLSGRGLGITGGTLDKLEAYDGYRSDLNAEQIRRQLENIGCVITGTTADIAPADRRLYALRDVTGTVPSIPLITASIMCKKLSESLDALVLDVKCGSGAFMQEIEAASQLARKLTAIGNRMHVPTTVRLTAMHQPLGRMVGNACEANEAVDVLCGRGGDDRFTQDVRRLSIELAADLLLAIDRFATREATLHALAKTIDEGRALERYEQLITAQGGRFEESLPLAAEHVVQSTASGWIRNIDCVRLGRTVIALGGGRKQQGDAIDHRVGLEMQVCIGDFVGRGQPLVRVFSDSQAARGSASQTLNDAFEISEESVEAPPLFLQMSG